MSTTVSFVDMQPSESTRLNVRATASLRTRCSSSGAATASVVSTDSIVAMPGANIPAPLAIPPTVTPCACATAVLATVSVVMMATAAESPPVAARAAAAAVKPGSSRSMSSRSPMSPVEQTATSIGPQPSKSATCSAVW